MIKTFTKQEKHFSRTIGSQTLTAIIRYDDSCKNGYNTFSIVCNLKEDGLRVSGGQLEDEFMEFFPEFVHLYKWHLFSSKGPIHYLPNTLYHVQEYEPRKAWVEYEVPTNDPLGLFEAEVRFGYFETANIPKEAYSTPGYIITPDKKTAKTRNLEHARLSAYWPEATDEELMSPDLAQRLKDRLPKLIEDFKRDIEDFGFEWEPKES